MVCCVWRLACRYNTTLNVICTVAIAWNLKVEHKSQPKGTLKNKENSKC